MKSILIFFIVSLTMPIHGQQQLHQALKNGDADMLGSLYAETVTMSIFDKEQTLPRHKAISMTKNFFNAHNVSGFIKIHAGASKDLKSEYLIGKMESEDQDFRIFINYHKREAHLIINEMRIEKK